MPNIKDDKKSAPSVKVDSRPTSSTTMETNVKLDLSSNKDVSAGPYLKFQNDLSGNSRTSGGFNFTIRF